MLEALHDAFTEQKYVVECPGRIVGSSGVQHTFDLLASREDFKYAVEVHVAVVGGGGGNGVAATTTTTTAQDDLTSLLVYYVKVNDATSDNAKHLLVVIPSLMQESKKLATSYKLDYVECEDASAAYEAIRLKIEEARTQAKWQSGIRGLDRLIGGGLLADRIYLVVGAAGTGKTTMAIQFVLQAAKQAGEKALLITTNQKPEEVIEMADSLGLELREQIKKGNVVIVDLTHQVEELKSKGLTELWKYKSFVSRIVGDISSHASRINARRIAIDTLTPLIPSHSYDQAREFVNALSGLGRLILITKEEATESSSEEVFVSGVIALRADLVEGKQVKHLMIKKFRGAPHDTSLHEYNIEQGVGVSVL